MRHVIWRTLEQNIRFEPDTNGQWQGPFMSPRPYGEFVKLLRDSRAQGGKLSKQVAVITFNYDLCLDYALYSHGLQPDYRLDDAPPADPSVKLLKLHGSLNWAKCNCGNIRAWHLSDFFGRRVPWDDFRESLPVASSIRFFRVCEKCDPNAQEPIPGPSDVEQRTIPSRFSTMYGAQPRKNSLRRRAYS